MPKVWFTADCHFGHSEIIVYCDRPFETRKEMDRSLIDKWNSRVAEDDLVFVLGDFTMKRTDIGFVEARLRQLNGRKILILGNHDYLNAFDYVDAGFESVHTHYVFEEEEQLIHLTHDPAVAQILPTAYWACGHVHKLFKTAMDGHVVNVGVDVRDYAPMSLEELIEEFWH